MRLTVVLVAVWSVCLVAVIGSVIVGALTGDEARTLAVMLTPLGAITGFAVGITLARR
jgi:hypothetical protein